MNIPQTYRTVMMTEPKIHVFSMSLTLANFNDFNYFIDFIIYHYSKYYSVIEL